MFDGRIQVKFAHNVHSNKFLCIFARRVVRTNNSLYLPVNETMLNIMMIR